MPCANTPSFPRKRESRASWTPASAGVTTERAGVTTTEGGSRQSGTAPGFLRACAALVCLLLVAACAGSAGRSGAQEAGPPLASGLSIAAAALRAGQAGVARGLYQSLVERFPDAPEPHLGLGYIALHGDDLDDASDRFLRAAALAQGAPEARAEALLGAARTALAGDDTAAARRHLLAAHALSPDSPTAAWIENGLAVAAALDEEYESAEAHYARAVRNSPGHPRITANLVRMLVAAGRMDEAVSIYREREPSYWEDDDRNALRRLVDEPRGQRSRSRELDSRLLLPWPAIDPPPQRLRAAGRLVAHIDPADSLSLTLRPADGAAAAPNAARARPVPPPPPATAARPQPTSVPAAETALPDARPPDGWVVSLGRSRRWQYDGAAKAVAAASPEIADVQLLSPQVLYVIGKKVGNTSVSVLGEDGSVQKRDVAVVPDVAPLRALLGREPDLRGVQVQPVARGVALTGEVGSAAAAGRALRLAAASVPEETLVENNLRVGLDLAPLRALMVEDSGLHRIRVQRVARGVALSGEVGSAAGAERALRLAAASLPEDMLVENNLRVVPDVAPLRAALAEEPGLEGVRVRQLVRGVALSGEVGSAAAAALAMRLAAASLPEETQLENNLRVAGPQQVNLEVQIAEVQRSVAEDFGFNWEAFGRASDPLDFGFRIGRALGVGDGVTVSPTTVGGVVSPSLAVRRAWDNFSITGVVDALAKAGLANVLARPNLTAVSGETASFFSGGEYPLPTGFEDGVIVFEYKKYGVLLDFVPTVIDAGRIELTVRPEVSEPSQDSAIRVLGEVTVPVINVRRAETTVEVGDGESIVIGGLFRTASNEVESGVPLLKDIPLVGALFGHTSKRSDDLELIVTVTARLVNAGPPPDPSAAESAATSSRNDGYHY